MEDLNKTIATTVASAIEAQAKAQFLTALGGTDHLIERFLAVAANTKVKRDYREIPLLDDVIHRTVEGVVKELIGEMVETERDALKAELAKRLRSDAKTIAAQLVEHIIPEGKGIYFTVNMRVD